MSIERLRYIGSVAAAATVVLSTAVPALADPISILSGSVFYSRQNQADFRVTGENGFKAQAWFGHEAWYPDYVCFTCVPGATLNVSQSESITQGHVFPIPSPDGAFELEGVRYLINALLFDIEAGDVTVAEGFTSTTPFFFRATLTGTADGAATTRVSLVGSGTARLLFGGPTLDYGWFESQYKFAESEPVPEPGTLLLFGTGAAVAIARRKRANQART